MRDVASPSFVDLINRLLFYLLLIITAL